MRLIDLEPTWLRLSGRPDDWVMVEVHQMEEAQGVLFLCPKCFIRNGGPEGTHMVISWDPTVPPEVSALSGLSRWKMEGTGFHDLTLVPEIPSAQLVPGCGWKGSIREGVVSVE